MGKRTFTETWIKNLKPHNVRRDFTEAGRKGFMLRVWPGGEKTFVLRYLKDDRSRVMTLGQWPVMSLSEAHEEHAEARKLVTRGIDPIDERERVAAARNAQERHERATSAITTRNVIAEWAWHWARRERKCAGEAIRLLKVYVAEPWKDRPVSELTKRDAVLLIDKITSRGAHVMAERIRNLAMQAFSFAISRDLITTSPWVGIPKRLRREPARERKLDADEMRTFWRALDSDDTEMSRPVRLALRLILVTAQRPGEVAGASWAEFDDGSPTWTIPASRSKNGREHQVPLTDLALEIISDLRMLAKERPHLLPSHRSKLKPDEPLSERALPRALRNNHKDGKLFGLNPFTPHDLRRTAASMMTSLGITRLHVSKVLNHTDQGVTAAVYDQHSYFDEKQRALKTWADHLRAIIAGKERKVVPIGHAKAAHA
jgi:integrase